MLSHWMRDGFEKRGSLLVRQAPGIFQVIGVTYTFIDSYQIELGIFVPAVDPSVSLRVLDDCHLFSAVGSVDGTMHMATTQFLAPYVEGLSDDEMTAYCRYIYDTCISHFFSVFSSEEECARLTKAGQIKLMSCSTIISYRDFLGIPRRKGKWVFEGNKGTFREEE